jgi:hypothetical protein
MAVTYPFGGCHGASCRQGRAPCTDGCIEKMMPALELAVEMIERDQAPAKTIYPPLPAPAAWVRSGAIVEGMELKTKEPDLGGSPLFTGTQTLEFAREFHRANSGGRA